MANDLPGGVAYIPVYNVSGETIPPHAAMRVVGRMSSDSTANAGAWLVIKPDEDNLSGVVFNGPVSISPLHNGSGVNFLPCPCACDISNADGEDAAVGDMWGTKAGQWTLWKGNIGFTCVEDGRNGNASFMRGDVLQIIRQVFNNPTLVPNDAQNSIIAYVANPGFTIPAAQSTVAVTITSGIQTDIWMVVGQTIIVTDGTNTVYGYVIAIADSLDFTLTVTRIAAGSAGNTMATGAQVIISGDPAGDSSSTVTLVTFSNSPYTVPAGVTTTIVDSSGGTVAVVLPVATLGNVPTITNKGPNPVTLTVAGGALVNGSATYTIPSGGTATFTPDGTNYTTGVPPAIATTATFVVPALGSPVTVTVQSTKQIFPGEQIAINDGTNLVYGIATPTSSTQFTFVPNTIVAGAVGNTVGVTATVTPQPSPTNIATTASFIIPAIGSGVTVHSVSTTQLIANQIVTISDGTHLVQGYVTSPSGTTFTFTPTAIYAGAVGNTVLTSATIAPSSSFANPVTSIASATTTDLSTINSNNVSITGNATINSFGTVPAGVTKTITFTGTPTLTYNATSMILPGGSSIAVKAGDTLTAVSLGGGNWQIAPYTSSGATPWLGANITTITHANSPYQSSSGQTLFVDTSGGAVNVLAPATKTNATLVVKKITTDPNGLVITPASGTIDGLSIWLTSVAYDGLWIENDGTNWWSIPQPANEGAGTIYTGSFSGNGVATTTFTVTIGVTLASAVFRAVVTPTDLLSATSFYVNNKTTTTFDVVFLSGLTGTVTFDWVVATF